MTKEEEKAIEIVAKYLNFNEICGTRNFKEALETVLNMLKERDNEIKRKNKIINEMSKYIDSNNYVDNEECQFQWDFKIEKCNSYYCRNCIKRCFEENVK